LITYDLNKSFIFISAAEAGWTLPAPVDFLERYLIAKRSVEKKLLAFSNHHIRPIVDSSKKRTSNSSNKSSSNSVVDINVNNSGIDETVVKLRPVIFRPSLIWTWKRPTALLSVIPFYIGSKVGIPFVDRPVTVENLVDAMIYSIENMNIEGIMKFNDIDIMSSKKM